MTRFLVAAALAVTAAGLVHVFRNRLLAPLLPRLVAELRRRFGAAADIRSVSLDERWHLVLEGVRIPLPRGVQVEVEHAVIGNVLAAGLPGGLQAARVREARGTVALVGDELPLSSLALPFIYRLDAGETHHPVQGTLEVRDGTWGHRRDERPGTPYVNVDMHVTAGLMGWTVEQARVLAGDAMVELEGHGAPEAAVNLRGRFMGVAAPLIEHLLAVFDPTLEVTVPADLQVSGLVEKVGGDALKVRAEAATAASSLVADVTLDEDRVIAGKLTGKLALADAVRLGVPTSGVHPLPNGEVMLDAKVQGSLNDPTLSGTAFLAALELATGEPGVAPVLRFFDVSAPFELTRDRLSLNGLSANGVSGKLMATSAVQLGIWPIQHESDVRWEGVRLEQIPTGPGAHGIGALVRGASAGQARLLGQGGDLELLTAEGEITIDDPEYLFVKRLEGTLSGYGLPVPATHGTGPCRAKLALSNGLLDVTGIRGTLAGLSFAGDVRARLDRQVSGRLTVTVEPAYLKQGGALAAGAGLGPLDVPLLIGGTVSEPEVKVDMAKAIGGFLKGKSMGDVMGALGNMLGGVKPVTPPKPEAESELDQMLGKILAGGPDAERLMDKLIATGISPEDVRTMLADYRRRRGL